MRSDPGPVTANAPTTTHLAARWAALWWALALLGCVALVVSPWLPWSSRSDVGMTVNSNGFNMITLGSDLPDLYPGPPDQTLTDDGTDTTLPSLSSIPDNSGGTDSNARWGVFVLALGATALFIVPWTLAGEVDRRRSMARMLIALGCLAAVPLIHDLLAITRNTSAFGPASVGAGLVAGLFGAAMVAVGAAMLCRALGPEGREMRLARPRAQRR